MKSASAPPSSSIGSFVAAVVFCTAVAAAVAAAVALYSARDDRPPARTMAEPYTWVPPRRVRAFLLPACGKPRELALSADEAGLFDGALTGAVGGAWVTGCQRMTTHRGTFAIFRLACPSNQAGYNTNFNSASTWGPVIIVRWYGVDSPGLSSIPADVQPVDWKTLFEGARG